MFVGPERLTPAPPVLLKVVRRIVVVLEGFDEVIASTGSIVAFPGVKSVMGCGVQPRFAIDSCVKLPIFVTAGVFWSRLVLGIA